MFKFVFFITALLSITCFAGEYAEQANENPFMNGELNPLYEGQLTALGGTVITHIEFESNHFYQLDLKIEGIEPIWVTSFIQPAGKPVIEKNDRVVFKGYISKSASLDSTGNLGETIKSTTLLLAIYVQNQGPE